jgi:hypothetical protein
MKSKIEANIRREKKKNHHICPTASDYSFAVGVSPQDCLKEKHGCHNEVQMLFFLWHNMVPFSPQSILFLNDSVGSA